MSKEQALAKHLNVPDDSIESLGGPLGTVYDNLYSCTEDRGEWLVLTDDEANEAWEQSLDDYLDECVLSEIKDKTLAQYFDREAWKRDARHDGRGHSLASYDGKEHEVQIDGEWFFIFRVN